RAAFLQRRLSDLVAEAGADSLDPGDVGAAVELLYAFRARSRATQYRLDGGDQLGAETSVDKVLVATAEQTVFVLAFDGVAAGITGGDDTASAAWRRDYL